MVGRNGSRMPSGTTEEALTRTPLGGGKVLARSRLRLPAIPLPWLLMLPAVLIVVVVTFAPIIQAVSLSFHETKFLTVGQFVGLEQYRRFFGEPTNVQILLNTFVYALSCLVLTVPLALGLALLLNRPFPGRTFFRTVLILPWVVSYLVSGLLWLWLDSISIGPVAYALSMLTNSRVDILGNPNTALLGVIVVTVWRTYPYALILSLAALQTISSDLYEAARIDGAGNWEVFRFVTLPMIQNTLLIVLIILSVAYFNQTDIPLVMTGGGPVDRTELIGLRVYREAFLLFNYGYGSAIAMVMFGVNVVISLAYVRTLRTEGRY